MIEGAVAPGEDDGVVFGARSDEFPGIHFLNAFELKVRIISLEFFVKVLSFFFSTGGIREFVIKQIVHIWRLSAVFLIITRNQKIQFGFLNVNGRERKPCEVVTGTRKQKGASTKLRGLDPFESRICHGDPYAVRTRECILERDMS